MIGDKNLLSSGPVQPGPERKNTRIDPRLTVKQTIRYPFRKSKRLAFLCVEGFVKNYSVEEEQRHFDQVAAAYEAHYSMNCPAALRKVQRLAEEFAQFLAGGPAGDLLEIGAGTGFFTRHLAPHLAQGCTLRATELSEGMLEVAERTLPTDLYNVTFCRDNCLHLSCGDDSMAGITGHGILHHLPLEPVLAEMARVLKPGGRIAFYEPNILNPYVFLIKTVPCLRPSGDTPEETALNPFSLAQLLRRHGFGNLRIIPCEFVLNGTPQGLVPLCEGLSRVVERLPLVKYLGGSLRIFAEKGAAVCA